VCLCFSVRAEFLPAALSMPPHLSLTRVGPGRTKKLEESAVTVLARGILDNSRKVSRAPKCPSSVTMSMA